MCLSPTTSVDFGVGVDQAVADACDGDQPASLGSVAELLADLAGVDAEVLGLVAVVGAPDFLEDRALGDGAGDIQLHFARDLGERAKVERQVDAGHGKK